MTNTSEYIDSIDMKKNSIFDMLQDMFSNLKSLFDGLALEQIVSLFNVLAYIILIINFTSILILIQGDKIINKFKL